MSQNQLGEKWRSGARIDAPDERPSDTSRQRNDYVYSIDKGEETTNSSLGKTERRERESRQQWWWPFLFLPFWVFGPTHHTSLSKKALVQQRSASVLCCMHIVLRTQHSLRALLFYFSLPSLHPPARRPITTKRETAGLEESMKRVATAHTSHSLLARQTLQSSQLSFPFSLLFLTVCVRLHT